MVLMRDFEADEAAHVEESKEIDSSTYKGLKVVKAMSIVSSIISKILPISRSLQLWKFALVMERLGHFA